MKSDGFGAAGFSLETHVLISSTDRFNNVNVTLLFLSKGCNNVKF